MPDTHSGFPPVPPDDLNRALTTANADHAGKHPHIGLVGDTYTITVDGEDTNGRFCVVDMHIPPGGGPGPHRHDFEETAPPKLDEEQMAAFLERAKALAPRYHTELLKQA